MKHELEVSSAKKREVRRVLELQLSEQRAEQQRARLERERYETDLLRRCEQELEAEKRAQ